MSNKSEVNAIIQDNYKINQNNIDGEDFKDEPFNEDNSFDQLYSLQVLIQKHSGLKELCKIIIIIYI